jgi:uroporphyrinogen decarboxylase
MRQAGRSLPEYRVLRQGVAMFDACLDPAMACEITLQPVRRYGVDAAIFFSDIMVPLRLAGVEVEIVPGTGPVLATPVRTATDVDNLLGHRLTGETSGALAPIIEAVRLTVAELGGTPLIGFAGAPFTLAAYLVEGGPSRDHLAARTMMHADPESWSRLMRWCADVTGVFLRAQLLAGASAGQLFDSWAGSLSRADYVTSVAPASSRALAWAGVPVGTEHLLHAMHRAGGDVIGVDYRTPLDEAQRLLGGGVPVQGNIDPAMLAAGWPLLQAHVREVLHRGSTAPSHVVGLGHGVPPLTDPDVLRRIVDFVHGEPVSAGNTDTGASRVRAAGHASGAES